MQRHRNLAPMRKPILIMLLCTWGGVIYFFGEIVWKIMTGCPEAISWTMLALAIVLCIPLEVCGHELPWSMPLWLQATICGSVITAAEFAAGCVLNLWLGLGIWDYSHLPCNLFGQICAGFWVLWCVCSVAAIPLFDWMCYIINGGDKPRYQLF